MVWTWELIFSVSLMSLSQKAIIILLEIKDAVWGSFHSFPHQKHKNLLPLFYNFQVLFPVTVSIYLFMSVLPLLCYKLHSDYLLLCLCDSIMKWPKALKSSFFNLIISLLMIASGSYYAVGYWNVTFYTVMTKYTTGQG